MQQRYPIESFFWNEQQTFYNSNWSVLKEVIITWILLRWNEHVVYYFLNINLMVFWWMWQKVAVEIYTSIILTLLPVFKENNYENQAWP